MNVFIQLYKSIYSPKDIASFRFQGIGKTIFFVFLLTFISILPSIFFISTAITTGIDSAREIMKEELPAFSIHNGQLSAKTSIPMTIKKKNFTIILDPTGAVSSKDVGETDNAFALLKNEFVFVAGGQTDTYAYSMFNGLKLTNHDVLNFLNMVNGVKFIIIPAISLFIYFFSSAASFIEITILALLGLSLTRMAGKELHYRQLWKMAAYSETLPTVFFTIMSALKTTVPSSFFINWMVVIIVLYLAIKEVPKAKKTAS